MSGETVLTSQERGIIIRRVGVKTHFSVPPEFQTHSWLGDHAPYTFCQEAFRYGWNGLVLRTGFSLQNLYDQGYLLSMKLISGVRFDNRVFGGDELTVHTAVGEIGNSSISIYQTADNARNIQVFSGAALYVLQYQGNSDKGTPVTVPGHMREAFKPFASDLLGKIPRID